MANINETLISIPGRLHSVASEGHVAGADEIFDDSLNKLQSTINSDVQTALGTGGTVDQKIATALEDVAFIDDSSSSPAVVPEFDAESNTVHLTAQSLSVAQKAQVQSNIGLGDVDARISNAVASEASLRTSADSTLQSNINAEKSRAQAAENAKANASDMNTALAGKADKATTLAGYGITDGYTKSEGQDLESSVSSRLSQQDAKIELYNGSEVVVVADHTSVSNPDSQKIYRQYGTTSYTDWMYQNGSWQAMATFDYPGVDSEPTPGSTKLISSGAVEQSEDTKASQVSDILMGDYKIIGKSLYDANMVMATNGDTRAQNGYSLSKTISTDGYKKVLIVGGGSPNIASCAMYDSSGTIVKLVTPRENGWANLDFIVEEIPSNAVSIRFCSISSLLDSGLVALFNGEAQLNQGVFNSPKVAEAQTYGYQVNPTNTATAAPRGCRFISASGYLDTVYLATTFKDNASNIMRNIEGLDIYHLNDDGTATLKDSIVVRMRGGKTVYKNGIDFDYKGRLERGDTVAWRGSISQGVEYPIYYENGSKYNSFYIYNSSVYWVEIGVALQFNIVPSLYDIPAFGLTKTEYQDIMTKLPRKDYVYDSGLTENDLGLGSTGEHSDTVQEGDVARGGCDLKIDDIELSFKVTPTTSSFDIRVGTRCNWYGMFVGIKNDGMHFYRQKDGIAANYMTEVFGAWQQPGFNMAFYQNVTYEITIRKRTTSTSRIEVTVSSTAGDYRNGVFCCDGYSDRQLYGPYDFLGTCLNGMPAIFAVTGNVTISKFRLRFPYKKDCQLIIYGHSFVEGNSLPYDKDKRFASLIQQNLGTKECCILGMGGDTIDTISVQNTQLRGMVTGYGYRPKYCLQMMGDNDSEKTYEHIIEKMQEFVTFCTSNSIVPVLMTLHPILGGMPAVFTQVNAWIRNSGYKYADIEKCFVDKDGNVKMDMYMSDQVHPTIDGHAAIYNTIMNDVPEIFAL